MIAIVDDDPSVRRALARFVRASGYSVTTYDSGKAFVGSLERLRPQCVVLDLNMPQTNGFDVLTALADTASGIPVIVITADHAPPIAERVQQMGAAACLPKPVDEDALLRSISTALREETSKR